MGDIYSAFAIAALGVEAIDPDMAAELTAIGEAAKAIEAQVLAKKTSELPKLFGDVGGKIGQFTDNNKSNFKYPKFKTIFEEALKDVDLAIEDL